VGDGTDTRFITNHPDHGPPDEQSPDRSVARSDASVACRRICRLESVGGGEATVEAEESHERLSDHDRPQPDVREDGAAW